MWIALILILVNVKFSVHDICKGHVIHPLALG